MNWTALANLLAMILTSEAHSPETKSAAVSHALDIASSVVTAGAEIATAVTAPPATQSTTTSAGILGLTALSNGNVVG